MDIDKAEKRVYNVYALDIEKGVYFMFKLCKSILCLILISMMFLTACSNNKTEQSKQPTPTPIVEETPQPTTEPQPQVDAPRVENVVERGKCASDMSWEFGDDGLLVIFGSGDMDNYNYAANVAAPWAALEVKKVVIHEGVASIGNCAFYNMKQIAEISIPQSVKKCGYDAFFATEWILANQEQFVVVGDGVLVKYNGASAEVTIPYGVKYISNAFVKEDEFSVDITGVKMPDSVVEIGNYAFYSCKFLNSVKFSNAVVSIGNGAFEGSGLRKEIVLPSTVEYIGRNAFANCVELYGIILPENLKKISETAFAYSNLNTIAIPASVEEIGYNPFVGCGVLNRIEVSEQNQFFASDEKGILYTKDMSTLVVCPTAISAKEIIVPETVKNISDGAFYKCAGVSSVVLQGEISYIGKNSFEPTMVISSKDNSYVHDYALENGIPFRRI